jgi:hypothetical protein
MSPAASPWTGLLESLHSALIDELIERHPEPKPELGLPVRQNRFAIPAIEIERLFLVEVDFGTSQGITLLASQDSFHQTIKLTREQLWKAMLHRAGPDFTRRNIQPKLSSPQELLVSTDAFPSSTLKCARVIWIPLGIPAGKCFLGVGV